jgi:hypothetical protein
MRIGRVLHCKEHDQTIYVSIYDALYHEHFRGNLDAPAIARGTFINDAGKRNQYFRYDSTLSLLPVPTGQPYSLSGGYNGRGLHRQLFSKASNIEQSPEFLVARIAPATRSSAFGREEEARMRGP